MEVIGGKIIAHDFDKVKDLLSHTQKHKVGFEDPRRFLLKLLVDGVEAQQVEFQDGCLMKFKCFECEDEVGSLDTVSDVFGRLSVYPSYCEKCRVKSWESHKAEKEKQDYFLKDKRCAGRQSRRVKHDGAYPMWRDLSDGYSFQKPLVEFISDVLDGTESGSLYIDGVSGAGKSFLCKILTNEMVNNLQPVCFVKAVDMAMALRRASMSRHGDLEKLMNEFRSVKTLIVDDYGTQKNTDFVRECMFSVFDYRYDNQKQTILTTNLTSENLEDERLESRFNDKRWMRRIPLTQADLRRNYKQSRI